MHHALFFPVSDDMHQHTGAEQYSEKQHQKGIDQQRCQPEQDSTYRR